MVLKWTPLLCREEYQGIGLYIYPKKCRWKKSFRNLTRQKKEGDQDPNTAANQNALLMAWGQLPFMWRLVTIIFKCYFFMVYCGFILYSGHSINVLINSLCYNLCTTAASI